MGEQYSGRVGWGRAVQLVGGGVVRSVLRT